MKAEDVLTLLEGLTPVLVLVPTESRGKRAFPLSATEILARYRRGAAWLLDEDVAERVTDGYRSLHLSPWGWLKVMEARIVTAEEIGGEFPGRHAAAQAIARTDDAVKPIPLKREWLLAYELRPGLPPLLATCAYWLRSRHHSYLALVQQFNAPARQEPAAEPIPVSVVRSLAPPPDTPLQ